MILVCGATGTIGSRVVERLTAEGLPVRALVSRKPSGPSSADPKVEVAVADLVRPETLHEVFEEVEQVFLLTPNVAEQAQMEANLIESARSAGVKHVVKLSVMGASARSSSYFSRLHGKSEQQLEQSGMAWTHIRSNMLMQNLRWFREALAQGVLPMPLGQAVVSHVDAVDVAKVISKVFTGAEHYRQAYTVTGPKALSGPEVAADLSSALDKSIQYLPISTEDFRAALKQRNDPEFLINGECELFEEWKQGGGSEVTDVVLRLTGQQPASLLQFARENKSDLSYKEGTDS